LRELHLSVDNGLHTDTKMLINNLVGTHT